MEHRYQFSSKLEAAAKAREILTMFEDPEYEFVTLPTGQTTLIITTKEKENEYEADTVHD